MMTSPPSHLRQNPKPNPTEVPGSPACHSSLPPNEQHLPNPTLHSGGVEARFILDQNEGVSWLARIRASPLGWVGFAGLFRTNESAKAVWGAGEIDGSFLLVLAALFASLAFPVQNLFCPCGGGSFARAGCKKSLIAFLFQLGPGDSYRLLEKERVEPPCLSRVSGLSFLLQRKVDPLGLPCLHYTASESAVRHVLSPSSVKTTWGKVTRRESHYFCVCLPMKALWK